MPFFASTAREEMFSTLCHLHLMFSLPYLASSPIHLGSRFTISAFLNLSRPPIKVIPNLCLIPIPALIPIVVFYSRYWKPSRAIVNTTINTNHFRVPFLFCRKIKCFYNTGLIPQAIGDSSLGPGERYLRDLKGKYPLLSRL